MNFDEGEYYTEEQEVLALVDDWLSTTPEIFGGDDSLDDFEDDFWYDEEDE